MKRMRTVIGTIGMLLVAALGQAAVIDAPHNETTGISCSSCHRYSLWWNYSPTTQNANPNHAGIVETICLTCHNGSGPGPMALNHSSQVMGSTLHGTWGVGCMDCHNPHYQDQLQWVDSPTELYLVTGTISGSSYSEALDQTTVDYMAATSNPNWPALGTLTTDPGWANKSLATPNRGLILVQDKMARTSTFLILSATDSQVVVRGKLDSNQIDPNYIDPQTQQQNSATCNTFGLIYGGLVRDSINSRPVKFFDPNGGFVAPGQDTTGICQVCHTATQRFTADGLMPADTDTQHADYATSNCTSCHKHHDGFKADGHDNSSFAWAGNCATCHDSNHTVVNIVSQIHGVSCGICHEAASGGGARVDGDPANGVDGSAIGATKEATCVDCHLTRLGLTGGEIHHTSQHQYASLGECTQCHADASGKLAADHTPRIQENSDCGGCHPTTAGSAAGAPVDVADAKVHDACTTCHETNGALKSVESANDPATNATVLAMQAGNCADCHDSDFARHSHIHDVSYDTSVDQSQAATMPGTPCASCHNDAGASLENWEAILLEHRNACATCHGYADADGLHSPPLAASNNAIASGTNVTCVTCHTEKMVGGTQATHGGSGHAAGWSAKEQHGYQAKQTGLTTCKSCHGPELASCTSCHSSNGFADWSSNCTFCHGDRASGRPSPPLDIQGRSVTTNTSVGRHDQHLGSTMARAITCGDCHLNHANVISDTNDHIDGDGIAEVTLGGSGVYSRTSATSSTCATAYCHGNFIGGTPITPNWTSTTAMTCTSCHPTTGQTTGAHARHTSFTCSVCHGSGYSATAANADVHINGVKNVGGSGTNITSWISSSQSCTPVCHGSKTWGGAADTTKPTDGTLTLNAGDAHIDLAWTPAIDQGGLWATNTYQVRFQTGDTAPTCFSGTSVYMGTAETFTHGGLANGSQYSYRVCAFDARGNFSDGITGTVTPNGP